MGHDELNRLSSIGQGDDSEEERRTTATTFFWILVAILVVLGICVLVSLALALAFGS